MGDSISNMRKNRIIIYWVKEKTMIEVIAWGESKINPP